MFDTLKKVTIKEWRTLVKVIRYPNDFFEGLKKQKGFRETLKYLAFLWILNSLLLFLISLAVVATQSASNDWVNMLPMAVAYFAIGGIVGFVTSLGIALIIHLYSKLFRGKGKLYQSFQLSIYASTPTLIFGWFPIPAVSLLATLYLIYLLYVGGQSLHGFSQKRSLIAFVIIPLLLVIASLALQPR